MLEAEAAKQRVFAMQRGAMLYKYNQGKASLFKSEGTRINPRWVQLSEDKTEVMWGDLKTRKLTSSVRSTLTPTLTLTLTLTLSLSQTLT